MVSSNVPASDSWSKTIQESRMFLSSYVKETPDGEYRAEIHQRASGYIVEYFKPTGEKFKTEDFSTKSIHYVTDAVENWIGGIKTLNG